MKQARDYRKYNVRLTSADWQRRYGRVISVYNVGMILVHRLKCDALEMFSVYTCVMYHEWTFRSA